MSDIDVLLQQIEQIRSSDDPGNIKASRIFSVRCQLKRLGWTPDGITQTTRWECAKCGNAVTTHVDVLEVMCAKHSPHLEMTHG